MEHLVVTNMQHVNYQNAFYSRNPIVKPKLFLRMKSTAADNTV